MKVTLQPNLLTWARQRAGLGPEELAERIGTKAERVRDWESTGRLTFAQAEKLAHVTHTPFGYLFLPSPPAEALPIADFRTVAGQPVGGPSPDLLDAIHEALRRQDWYRDYLVANGGEPLPFVGVLPCDANPNTAAVAIRHVIQWEASLRARAASWEEALTLQIECVEAAGILVMRSGIVGNNTHRPLSPEEFRGFALSDPYAPLVFLNGRDARAAQMFTLAHEVAHVWLGASGVSNLRQTYAPDNRTERFCNAVAAELLMPTDELRAEVATAGSSPDLVPRLARHFKVSSLVVLRRLHDVGELSDEAFRRFYQEQLHRFAATGPSGGGNFYRTLRTRLGRRFVTALVASALEGHTLYRDAYRLLGVSGKESLRKLGEEVGVAA